MKLGRIIFILFIIGIAYGIYAFGFIGTPKAKDLGIEEILNDKDSITFVEWPKLIEEFFSNKTIYINFEHISENERKITENHRYPQSRPVSCFQ